MMMCHTNLPGPRGLLQAVDAALLQQFEILTRAASSGVASERYVRTVLVRSVVDRRILVENRGTARGGSMLRRQACSGRLRGVRSDRSCAIHQVGWASSLRAGCARALYHFRHRCQCVVGVISECDESHIWPVKSCSRHRIVSFTFIMSMLSTH